MSVMVGVANRFAFHVKLGFDCDAAMIVVGVVLVSFGLRATTRNFR